MTHLKDRSYYEDIYDRTTVEFGRDDTAMFNEMSDEFFKIMPDEPRNSHRAVFHLNLVYFIFVGNRLLDRYDRRDDSIRTMMAKDEAKDQQVAEARLTNEPKCQHCGEIGLRIVHKSLHWRRGFDEPEDVLFMLECSKCKKNTAVWGDGAPLEHHKTHCPKCQGIMTEKDTRKGKVLTTTYTCPTCAHTYKDELDLRRKEKQKPDPSFETDRVIYCLHDEKFLKELRDAKWRYEEMAKLGKEMKEKEENKLAYEAVAALKKPKIGELASILQPVLDKEGYMEFSLDKPDIGTTVRVGFSCLDSKSDRQDYESRKTLQKAVRLSLEDTNWRLTNDGISYRLGYLSGTIRAYEREEDMVKLVAKNEKLMKKAKITDNAEKNSYRIKGKNGEDILL